MTFVRLDIKLEWRREQTDLSKCCACEDVIYGDMVRAVVNPGEKETPIDSLVFCQSCFELLNYEPE
jgi:hypothetical protein